MSLKKSGRNNLHLLSSLSFSLSFILSLSTPHVFLPWRSSAWNNSPYYTHSLTREPSSTLVNADLLQHFLRLPPPSCLPRFEDSSSLPLRVLPLLPPHRVSFPTSFARENMPFASNYRKLFGSFDGTRAGQISCQFLSSSRSRNFPLDLSYE